MKHGRVAPVPDGDRRAGEPQAAGIVGFLRRDRHEEMGDLSRAPFHGERRGAARQGARLIEQEAMAGIGDAWHARRPRRQSAEEAAQRHMGMDHVGLFGPQQPHQGHKACGLGQRRGAPFQRQRHDAEALGPKRSQQRAVGAGADHLVAARAAFPQQRRQEVPHRKIGVRQLDDSQIAAISRLW
jgi:hypothetical protein